MKHISILGSTGSIGTQTLDVVRTNCDICVEALAAGRNIGLLLEQIKEFQPKLVCVFDADKAKELEEITKKEQLFALLLSFKIFFKSFVLICRKFCKTFSF